ncbi:MAG: endonuclease/exonuclease/phosphatase family protein, partial [Gammaproteobacteria bacterium]|nr:endonuclease/exonuclease/phosphatase family protein [Gemmatimonadota bacterium]NIU78030.1 endonuclease/exonuclease/phosphatase family protein [Gammaproteobacteria bacterium]
QYGMVGLSRFPMDGAASRTFRSFLWRDLPGHHMPEGFYSAEAEAALPLSSKSHWDLPIVVGDQVLHVWASHPTPPVFDGDEDRNGRRNFDEIGFWRAYLEGSEALHDDQGRSGGFSGGAPFVIAGDLNAQPGATESLYEGMPAIAQLLDHPRVQDPGDVTRSRGALQGRSPGPPDHPERSTASFLGGVRVDYVLPSSDLTLVGGGVFWPDPEEDPEGAALAEAASDHRLVWIDVVLPGGAP